MDHKGGPRLKATNTSSNDQGELVDISFIKSSIVLRKQSYIWTYERSPIIVELEQLLLTRQNLVCKDFEALLIVYAKGGPEYDEEENGRLKIKRVSENFWYATGTPIYQVELDTSQFIIRTSTHLTVYDISLRKGVNEVKHRWQERLYQDEERIYCLTHNCILFHRGLDAGTRWADDFALYNRRDTAGRRLFTLPAESSLKMRLPETIVWQWHLSILGPLVSKSGMVVIKRDEYTFYVFDVSCNEVRVKVCRSSRKIAQPVLMSGGW